jgi:hypothetical protein
MDDATETDLEIGANGPTTPITAQLIHDLLLKGVVRQGKAPKTEALIDLAGEADQLRICFRQQTLIAWDAQAKLEGLIEQLLLAIPSVIKANERMLKYRETLIAEKVIIPLVSKSEHGRHHDEDRQGKALRDLEAAAKRIFDPGVGVGWRVFPDVRGWQDFAVPLSDSFATVMRHTNPGTDYPPSNDGPVSRFMEKIIPLITSETPNRETVARHLQREKEKGNTTHKPVTR